MSIRSTTIMLAALLATGFAAVPCAHADLANLDKPAEADAMEAAVALHTDLIKRDPNSPHHYFARGEAQFKLRDFEGAVADFSTAIKLNPKFDDALFGRGMALARNGDIAAGIADLDIYIQRHPKSSFAFTKRGVRHLWNGDFARAERDLARAIALDSRNAEAHDDLGVIYAQRENYATAAQHFRTTIRLEPQYQKAYHNLAFVYYLMDEDIRALKAVDGALALGADRDSMMLKGLILEALGRDAEARAVKSEAEFLPEGNWSERLLVQ